MTLLTSEEFEKAYLAKFGLTPIVENGKVNEAAYQTALASFNPPLVAKEQPMPSAHEKTWQTTASVPWNGETSTECSGIISFGEQISQVKAPPITVVVELSSATIACLFIIALLFVFLLAVSH